jgi:hypothetical protein
LDNGKFYRKPFGWLYASISIAFLLAPVFLVFSTIWWNNANRNRMESQKTYMEVLQPKYDKIKFSTDTLAKKVAAYGKEMNNAIDCLTKATKQADYYGEYASYGPEYQQIYSNALDVKRQWDQAYKDVADRWDVANAELDGLKVRYERIRKLYEQARNDYESDRKEFDFVDRFGAVFQYTDAKGGKNAVILVLFVLMALLTGTMNFLLWWSRLLDLKSLVKVQDKFVVTPVAAHFIQTVGESLGITIAVWGFFTAVIQLTCQYSMMPDLFPYFHLGVVSLVLPIGMGFLAAFLFRIAAELLKSLVVLANNKG